MMKIGSVKVEYLINNHDNEEYSDGPVEDELLSLVKGANFADKRADILNDNPSWPIYYHLSPARGNLVNWFQFEENSSVLEVGAGCGAITESLVATVPSSSSIDALELSEKRALINSNRNKSAKNLRVLIGNLDSLEQSNHYSYIVCVGVLEYAGKFINSNDPFRAFVESLYKLLKPGGQLLLAIENKLGLKYFNGSREDHTGRFYDSLMSYPQSNKIKTFSRNELINLLCRVGFVYKDMYLPVPDYKFPKTVINEKAFSYLEDTSFLIRSAPAPAPDRDRIYSASEQLITQSILDAKLYPEFSNSFLIHAIKGTSNE